MKHNDICCAHCGFQFDFSESPELLVNGKTFAGLCERCRQKHYFAVHIIDDMPGADGICDESIMVDVHPAVTPPQAPKPEVARETVGNAILLQSMVHRTEGDGDELEKVSEETYKDLDTIFGVNED